MIAHPLAPSTVHASNPSRRSRLLGQSFGWAIGVVCASAIASPQGLPARADGPQPHHSPQPAQNADGHGGHQSGNHSHQRVEIPAGQPLPSVVLAIQPDRMKGWNLHIQVQNFQFTPEQIDRPGAWNTGHAHLYVNGRKLTRLYGPWYYLDALPSGENQIVVTLNTNGHEELYANGQRIEARAIVRVP
ncbi:MAG TPA: hypothetical protein V6D46_02035 [Coleofasciculaceae cyanobacterium]